MDFIIWLNEYRINLNDVSLMFHLKFRLFSGIGAQFVGLCQIDLIVGLQFFAYTTFVLCFDEFLNNIKIKWNYGGKKTEFQSFESKNIALKFILFIIHLLVLHPQRGNNRFFKIGFGKKSRGYSGYGNPWKSSGTSGTFLIS